MKHLLCVLLLASSAFAQESTPANIVFPFPKTVVEPPPKVEPVVDPTAIPKLYKGILCPLKADVQCVVRTSPAGYVTVKTFPPGKSVVFYGVFTDSKDSEPEERTYDQPWIANLIPEKTGRIEIIISPAGAVDDKQDFRQIIDVFVAGPRPPPKPVDPVVPPPNPDEPDPPVVVPDGAFKVLFLYESAQNLTREQLNTMNSTKLRGWLKQNTVEDGFRFWDDDVDVSKESKDWQNVLSAAKSAMTADPQIKLPCVVVFHGTQGKAYNMPATESATREFLVKQKGQ